MAAQPKRVEYPIRGIQVRPEWNLRQPTLKPKIATWKVVDVKTGKTLESFEGPNERILLVLDGDHVLTKDFTIYSISEWKEKQDVEGLRDFFGEPEGGEFEREPTLITFPANERYAYVVGRHSHEIFDPDKRIKKIAAFTRDEDITGSMSLWSWDGNKLEEESTFTFSEYPADILPLPERSQVLGGLEVMMTFENSFAIFNVETQEILREFHFGDFEEKGVHDIEYFILPDGRLCSRYIKEDVVYLTDVTQVLEQGEENFIEMKVADIPVIANYPYTGTGAELILEGSDDKLLFLLGYEGKPWKKGKEGIKKRTDVKVEGEIPVQEEGGKERYNYFCLCSFHGQDIAFVRGNERGRWWEEENSELVFVDLDTGKTKQVLDFKEASYEHQSSAIHLPGDMYLMENYTDTPFQRILIKYDSKKKEYSLGPASVFDFLLPISKAQKKAMETSLDKVFLTARAPVPKEIVGIVAGFI